MNFTLPDSLDLLRRTPSVLRALLGGSSPNWHTGNEGPESWTAAEVVAHLLHAEETNWIPRARMIRDDGGARPFEPFDRFAHLRRFPDLPLDQLLDRFGEAREQSLEVVRGWDLSDADLALTGSHPELGTVTLRQLLATWTIHDLTHLAQITRVMARRYADDVGPWREFLSVLRER